MNYTIKDFNKACGRVIVEIVNESTATIRALNGRVIYRLPLRSEDEWVDVRDKEVISNGTGLDLNFYFNPDNKRSLVKCTAYPSYVNGKYVESDHNTFRRFKVIRLKSAK